MPIHADRMEVTGARWSPDDAEAVPESRAHEGNGDWRESRNLFDPMTAPWVHWSARCTGFALIGILALISPPDQPLARASQIACFAAVGAALLACMLAEAIPRRLSRAVPAALGVMAVAGGLAAVTSGEGQSLVGFAALAALVAGSDLGLPAALSVATAGILPIWIAGPIAGSTPGTLAGYPLLILMLLSFGRNRRSHREQARQSAAFLAQYERLQAEQRRADVLDERTRIAREIHDVLAHSLGALGIQVQAAKALLTDHEDIDRAVEALSTAQRMAADGLAETRRAVHALRADTASIDEEIAKLAAAHRQRFRVPVTFEASGETRPLPPDALLALVRIAQEGLVNAAKHAPGEPVAVTLGYGERGVRLTVVNPLSRTHAAASGPGSAGGYGLTGMRERLQLLNGTLDAGPRAREWTVTAELPLASQA